MARLEAVARMRQAGQDMDLIRAALGVATDSPQYETTVTPLTDTAVSLSPQVMLDRLAGTLEAAIGEGERWGAVLARLETLERDTESVEAEQLEARLRMFRFDEFARKQVTETPTIRLLASRLDATEKRLAEMQSRIAALEARKPRFGWVALSVAIAATAGALLGRPVPVEAAPSLAAQVSALKKDVALLKVAANTLADRDFWLRENIPARWIPFVEAGRDRRPVVSQVSNEKDVLQHYANFPALKPDPLYDSDLCEVCNGVVPRP